MPPEIPNKDDEFKGLAPTKLGEREVELFSQFLRLQTDELQLKREQLQISREEQANAHEFSKLALAENRVDRDAGRKHKSTVQTKTFFFIGFLVLVFLLFAGVAMLYDKEAMVLEIAKAAVFLVAGGAGGYAACMNRMIKQASESAEDADSN